jgi:hypothetical protein
VCGFGRGRKNADDVAAKIARLVSTSLLFMIRFS